MELKNSAPEESESLLLREFSASSNSDHRNQHNNTIQHSKPVIQINSTNNCDSHNNYNQLRCCDCQLQTGKHNNNNHQCFEDITLNDDEHYQLLSSFADNDSNFSKDEQSTGAVFRQMLLPFIVAGLGSTFAGIILERITTTNTNSSTVNSTANSTTNFSSTISTLPTHSMGVFAAIPQLEIMVPAFIGLIGNIQTTLASRLSTAANLGALDKRNEGCDNQRLEILTGNAAVVFCQAAFTGLFAALASLAISTCSSSTRAEISFDGVLLLCSSAVLTSTVAAALMATLIFTIVLTSRKYGVNPDNISTPVAASLGDVCSLSILAFTSRSLYGLYSRAQAPKLIGLMALVLLVAAISAAVARRCRHTSTVILTGWAAILGAVLVEQPGGMVMEKAIGRYRLLAALQPLVNGIGSNLVGIQTSRLSTYLHSQSASQNSWQIEDCDKILLINDDNGAENGKVSSLCVSPAAVFFSKDINSRVSRLLLAILLPAHLFFLTLIYFLLQNGHLFPARFSVIHLVPSPAFLLVYCSTVAVQLVLLLYVAHLAVHWAWSVGVNPDNAAIPFTSALADLLGNCLMAVAFFFLGAIRDPNAPAANF